MAEVTDSNPFDLTRIRQLVRLMRENDLAEIDLRWQHSRLRLRRGAENVVLTNVSPAPHPRAAEAGPGVASEPAGGSAGGGAASKAADTSNLLTITSPIVGTFYRSPSPETEAFVAPGSKVRADTVVCIIEAMKVFNEIPAGMAGTIREVLVENGAPVEYGQPLFRLEP